MLSPNQLERASDGYRRGYYDGYYGRLAKLATVAGPFHNTDYLAGYAAGANDQQWSCKGCGR